MSLGLLPIPAEITRQMIEHMPVGQKYGWKKAEDYRCRACESPALLNPYSNLIWGCESCNYSTYSPSLYFEELLKAA